mmetsp:Transcript_17595/g.45353  ORF Transcript_17595/g.45353 Transcript_17595/m.45353 type:complete len:296 (+) Transcript_17595:1022-1909(+)
MESYGSQSTSNSSLSSSFFGACGRFSRCAMRCSLSLSRAPAFFLLATFCLGFGMRPTVGRPSMSSRPSRMSAISLSHSSAAPCASSSSSAPASSSTTASSAATTAPCFAFGRVARFFFFIFGGRQRFGRWNTSRVQGSQKVTQSPCSRVMTHVCSTTLSSRLPSSFALIMPLQTHASFLLPSSTEHSSSAWSCTGPFRVKRKVCGSFQPFSGIRPWRSCFEEFAKDMQLIQCNRKAGSRYSSGVMMRQRNAGRGSHISGICGCLATHGNRRRFWVLEKASSLQGLAPIASGNGTA